MKSSPSDASKVPAKSAKGVPAHANGTETQFIDFESSEGMVVVNANNDDKEWGIYGDPGSKCGCINWNSEKAMDDWFMMPAVSLEGGKAYEISLDMWGKGDSYPEKIEVFIGTEQTPDAMTIEVIPVTAYGGTTAKRISSLVSIPTSGTYYVGIHGCSDPDMYTLFIDNVAVSAPMSADMPEKISGFSAVAKDGAEGVATISLTAPDKRFNGNTLTSLDKIEVSRNGSVVKTFTNPTPGSALSFDDDCGVGKFTWTAVAYNESGASLEVSATLALTGTYAIPYHKDFPTGDSLDEMTVIDNDNDNNTWYWDQYQKYAGLSSPQGGSDDWIITPAIMMNAGKVYEFSTLISAGNPEAFPPRVAVYVGAEPTPEAMTTTIIPATQITKYDTYFNEGFSVPSDGKYYVGVHGCSTEYLALIKLMYLDITGGAEAEGPAIVMNGLIEPDWTARTNTANISFTAPVTTGSGNRLTSISRIDIQRDGSVVKSFENPTPGNDYSYTDEVDEAGTYTYAVVPYNEVGQGGKLERTINIGEDGKPVPYLEDFTTTQGYDNELTFIDYNEDGTSFWHASQLEPPCVWIHYGESSPTNDDYLVTPAIRLEANTVYRVSADAWGYQENMEILAGDAPKVGNLTTTVVPLTELGGSLANYGGTFTSTYAGNYYFSVHAKTEKRIDSFYTSNIRVEKVGATTAPSKVTDLTMTPSGADGLDISFKAPVTTVAGDELQSIEKITVTRDGTEIKSFENPAPGAVLTLEDTPGSEGEHTYRFIPTGDGSEGEILSHVAFIGEDLPAMPQNVVAEYLGEGKMKVSWDPVTTTAHGVSVPAQGYVILEVKDDVQRQLTTVTECEYTYNAVDPENQAFIYYGVFPVNSKGDVGEYGVSNDCYAGKPYTMSYMESFADGAMGSVIRVQGVIFEPEWALATNASFSDVQPSDGDNGMVAMKGGMGSSGRLSTGMIDLKTNSTTPTLSFNVYNISPTEYTNEIYVDVREVGSDEWTQVAGHVIKDLSQSQGWVRVDTDLGAYKGKNVFIGIRPVGYQYLWTIFDAIRVSNLTDNDLGANMTLSASTVPAGENVSVSVTVSNNGQKDAEAKSYEVELYKNGKVVETRNGRALKAGETRSYIFNQTLDVQDSDIVEYSAVIVNDGDENMADNTTKTLSVEVVKPIYPMVRNLTASGKGSDVTLNWDEPSMDNVAPAPFTETFESAESWNRTGVCGWTFTDADNTPSGGFEQFAFPGITTAETVTSFFVIDKNEPSLGEYGSLLNGVGNSSKCIGALLRYDGGMSDDWAISPELYGGRQTISFFAMVLLNQYPETFQAYYSTGGISVSDFIPVGNPVTFNQDSWTEFTANLPEGAKRFALRRISSSGALMMVDDITMRLAGDEPENLTLVGYNVYRDGTRVNTAPVAETSFNEAVDEAGPHTYSVSAVYEQGESNTVHTSVDVSGINQVSTSAPSVFSYDGHILIRGASGLNVAVSTVDGRSLFSGKGTDNMKIEAPRGICVVRAGKHTFKVIVR